MATPEEKAAEPIDKFTPFVDLEKVWVNDSEVESSESASEINAVKCAAICVQEILNNNFWEETESQNNYIEYWQQVLTHLKA